MTKHIIKQQIEGPDQVKPPDVIVAGLDLRPELNLCSINENRLATKNDFYRLRLGLVACHALSWPERIAGRRAAARHNGRRLAAHEGRGQSARRKQFSR